MERRFAVEEPEQLREMAPLVKEGYVQNVATVWNAERRRRGGKCAWDGQIVATFKTSGKLRSAVSMRVSSRGEEVAFAQLKYAPALAWCKEHLEEVSV